MCVNGVAPTYLRELCVPMQDVRGRPRLRSASTRCILLPRVQTSTGQRSFAYSGHISESSVSSWTMSVVDHDCGPCYLARCILLPRVQTSTGQRSFAYRGPAVWNSLPPALRENMSLATFKTKLKTYLFRRSQ